MNPVPPGGSGDTGKSPSTPPSFGSSRSAKSSRAKKKSGIPKLAKRSSVIFSGGLCGVVSRSNVFKTAGQQGRGSTSLGSFRVPWVPAPGKTSAVFPPASEAALMSARSRQDINEDSSSAFISSSSSVNSCSQKSTSKSPPPVSQRRSQVESNLPPSNPKRDFREKKSSNGGSHNGRKSSGPSGDSDAKPNNFCALKSKDSLIQITSFLQDKRDEILKLWQENLTNKTTSEGLLQQFEKANLLALEAAKEVESLRLSIQNLQTKESSLSSEEVDLLDDLRNSVLSKVKAFEETNTKVFEMIGAAGASAAATETSSGRVPVATKSSGTSTEKPSTVIVNGHLEDSDSSTDEEVTYLKDPSNFISNVNSKTASSVPSTMDLSRLAQMYAEEYSIAPMGKPSSSKTLVASHSRPSMVSQHKLRGGSSNTQRLGKDKRHPPPRESLAPSETSCSSDQMYEEQRRSKLYKAKISSLQRQLHSTEVEMEDLRSELERVESDSNFQVRMLRSSFQDKLEEVEACPPMAPMNSSYFHSPRQPRVTESHPQHDHQFHNNDYRRPHNIRREVEERDREIEHLREDNQKSQAEIKDIQSKLRNVEGTRDQLVLKVADLNQTNINMRRELDRKTMEVVMLTEKFESFKIQQAEKSWSNKMNSPSSSSIRELRSANEKLVEEIRDLKRCLSKAKKNVEVLQISKKKMSVRHSRRQEELIEELEKARMRNKKLQSQIHYLRTTYHELFPPEIFQTMAMGHSQSPDSRVRAPQPKERPSHSHKKRQIGQRRSKTVIFGLSNTNSSADEQVVTKSHAWKTGVKRDEGGTEDIRETINANSISGNNNNSSED